MARVVGAKNRFKLSEIERAVRATRKAGLTIARVEVDRAGRIAVVAGEPTPASDGNKNPNPWDQILNVDTNSERPA